jgi:hypothetical protein
MVTFEILAHEQVTASQRLKAFGGGVCIMAARLRGRFNEDAPTTPPDCSFHRVGFAFSRRSAFGQPQSINGNGSSRGPGKPVTVPVTIRVKEERRVTEYRPVISEDGEPQTIISLRGIGTNSPITLAVLIQEDLVPSVGNEIKALEISSGTCRRARE